MLFHRRFVLLVLCLRPGLGKVKGRATESHTPGIRQDEWDVRPYADEVHVRHFFHLSVEDAEVPDRWIAVERGDGDSKPIRFELYWLPLAQGHVLAAGQSALLGRLFD